MDKHQIIRKGMFVRRTTYNACVRFTKGQTYQVESLHTEHGKVTGIYLKDDIGISAPFRLTNFELVLDRDTASLLLS